MADEPPDLSQEPDAALVALAGGGEDLISARQDRTNMLVSSGPDVLWTPRGGGKQPVAYSVVAPMDTSVRISNSVRNNGEYDFQLNSRTTDIIGHEPGTLKGVVEPGYKRYSHVETGADYLFSEGFANVSHRDPAWINRDEEGPREPMREMSTQLVAQMPRDPNSLLFDPAPLGSPQTFSPFTPGAVDAFRQETERRDALMRDVQRFLDREARTRRGGAPNRSGFRRNAHGETNVDSTAAPASDSFGMKLMKDLARKQGFTPDQAAGVVGNASGESGNFTKIHEVIAAHDVKGKDGKIIRTIPQHVAGPKEGGRGVIQWTKTRRNDFKQLIAQRKGLEYDAGTDFPDSQYADYGNNEAMIEHDFDGPYSNVASSIKQGGTAGVPSFARGSDLSVATWRDFTQYEGPGVYQSWKNDQDNETKTRAVKKEFGRRLDLAKKFLN